MISNELRGVIVPAITPINDNEEVDESAFRKVLRRLIKSNVNAIFVGGSAGEGPLLSDRQWRRMVEIAFDEVRGETPLLGGAIDTSTRRVCEKVKLLGEIGYRQFVVTPTFYIAVKTPSEHLRLYGQAKEAAGDMEIVAYNIPQCTGSVLGIDTVCEMAKRGWIRYCKESSGDLTYARDLIAHGKDVGLTVLAGDEFTCNETLLAGAGGIVPVCANYDPRMFAHLYDVGSRGDRDALARVMTRMWSVRENLVLSSPCWLSGIKYAVASLGLCSATVMSPLEPATPTARAAIDALVKADRAAGAVSP